MSRFDVVYDRMGTGSIKWDRCKGKFETDLELLPLWIADTDFKAPNEVLEALHQRIDHGIFGYTFAMPDYLQSVANWYKHRHNLDILPEMVVPTYGVVTALRFTIEKLTKPKDKVMILTPAYEPFFAIINNTGRELVELELDNNSGYYTIDFTKMEDAFKSGVKLFLFCNPHNPCGRVWTADELKIIADLCEKYNVYLASDEIHGDVELFGNKYISMASFENVKNLVMVYTSAGKGFALTGSHTSSMIIPDPQLRETVASSLRDAWIMSPNLFGLVATQVAYDKCEYWLDEEIAYLESNSEYVCDFLKANMPEIIPTKHEATYLMWLDCSNLGYTDEQLFDKMLNDCRLGLGVGSHYGAQFGQFMRLNMGVPMATLEKGMNQLLKFKK